MKRQHRNFLRELMCTLIGVCLLAGAAPAFCQSPPSANTVPAVAGWPREFQRNGDRLVIYQPQVRDWQKFRELTADTAVSLTPSDSQQILGVVSWHATTLTDTQSRLVVVKDIVLTNARFASLDPAQSAAMERRISGMYPAEVMTISLDRMLAGFRSAQSPPHAAISTEPPAVFVSTSPALLLFVDGDPIRVPIEGTSLEYVVNTNWDLLYDKSDYYLLQEKTWLKAKTLAGPWTVTAKLPPDVAKLPRDQNWDDVRRAMPPLAAKVMPRVFFTARPAELLLFNGDPVYARIAGTSLAYATNTDNDVFLHSPDRQMYILLSGRWFRAAKLQGPWTYAGNDLPRDFARIPASHPRAHVLSSVPGTQAARDAVLLAQVPTTAVVNRAEAESRVKVAYAGDPQFKTIESTSLSYAVNTQEKVIKYGDLYYLCFQGVWFMSTTPQGPWKTADSVPKQIYAIPSTSPVYNVTYVTVSNPTSTTVESSYTSGYMGMFVLGAAVGACVAYGTGYYYPPYYYWGPYPHPVFYPYPYSYGARAVYNPYTGFYGVGSAVYGPYGAAGRAAWYNPSTGTYGRAASVQTAYGGRTVAQAYNPWTGTYGATRQGHNAYAQWGTSVVTRGDDWARSAHVTTSQGTVTRFQTSDGTAGRIYTGKDGSSAGVVKHDNNVYAGNDGNVYRKDSSGNWSKYDNGNWTPVDTSSAKAQAQQKTQTSGISRDSVQQKAQSQGVSRESVQQQAQAQGISRESVQQRAQGQGLTAGAGTEARQGTTPAATRSREQISQQSAARGVSVPSGTMQQLDREASSRQVGAQREQMYNRANSGNYGGRQLGTGSGIRRR